MFNSRFGLAVIGLAMMPLGAVMASCGTDLRPEPDAHCGVVVSASMSGVKPEIVSVRNLATGQELSMASVRRGVPGGSGGAGGVGGRGAGRVVFDNYSSPNSTSRLNIAYFNSGSYDGSDPSTTAIVLPMADRSTQHAPFDAAVGLPVPTDIVWNEYRSDPSAWPGGAATLQALHALSLVCFISNVEGPNGSGPPRYRADRLQIRFFTADGLTDLGGVEVMYNSPPAFASYFSEELDLSGLNPAIQIPRDGLVMLDWVGNNLAGVGSMHAGGDLIHPDFPRPETLFTIGTTDPATMFWADGIIGIGGYPIFLDPGYDGDPSSTSYLDVLNAGEIANWNIHLGEPPFRVFCRDFPCKIVIGSGVPPCPCDMDSSGFVNSQDFFDFLVGFFSGNADFNGSGTTDSQDFFDFLVCFFIGC